MSDLKRRKLGQNKGPKQNQGPRTQNQPQGQPRQQSPSQGQSRQQNQARQQNQPRQQNQGQNQNQNSNRQQNQSRSQGPNQRVQSPQGRGQHTHHRPPLRQAPRPPPPPPAYMQRDLLLVADKDSATGVDTVRSKFDPLAKKVPTHVTLLFPEPAKLMDSSLLKAVTTQELPSLETLTFSQVLVHDEMYLWLMPDAESRDKIVKWREIFFQHLISGSDPHSQGEEFLPHITLGYIPRSLTPEEAMAFAHNALTLPLTLNFEKILLEEFSENQVSTSVDSLSVKPTV
jgi:hypothetical protein